MQNMTTTDLRTKSSELIKTLKNGGSVDLIHHSKVVGEIRPKPENKVKVFNAKAFKKAVARLNLRKTTYEERDRIYRKHLMEKYGKNLR